MKHSIVIAVLCVMLLGVGSLALHAQEAPPVQPTVQKIDENDIHGYVHASADVRQKVLDILTPLAGKPYDTDKIEQAKEEIESLGWIFSAAIKQEPADGGVKLVVNLVENVMIDKVEFIGNTTFDDNQLAASIGTKAGEILNQRTANQDARAIHDAYDKKGYTLSEVIDVHIDRDAEKNTNTLVYEILEPCISEIRITGTTRTREYVIARQFDKNFQVGKTFNTNAVSATLKNLNQLGIFQEVTAQPEIGTKVGTILVNLHITERRTGTAGIGIAQNSVDGWTGFFNAADNNLLGTGQRLSLNLRFGAEDSYQLSYTHPWIDQQHTSMTVSLYDRSILREAFVGSMDNSYQYIEERRGGKLSFARPFSDKTRMVFSLRADHLGASEDDTIPDNIKSLLLSESDVRSVGLMGLRDTHENAKGSLRTINGSYYSLGMEYAGFGGADFTKFSAEARRYITVKANKKTDAKNWVYATRLMAGTSTGVPPFLDQFQLGGSTSMRGYKEDRFPGQNMVLWNHELRVPVTEAFELVGFTDCGDAWGGRFAKEFGDSKFDFHYSYGLGLLLQTPIGPLRLDYGLNDESKSEFSFGMGSTF